MIIFSKMIMTVIFDAVSIERKQYRDGIERSEDAVLQGHLKNICKGKREKRQVKSIKLPMGELCPCSDDHHLKMINDTIFSNDIFI